MFHVLLVGLGGFVGSAARYVIGRAAQQVFTSINFPFGTLTVNVLGCLFIGLLSGLAETRQTMTEESRLFLMVGLLGGFTTFAAFAQETHALHSAAESMKAILNISVQIITGLGAVWIGNAISRYL